MLGFWFVRGLLSEVLCFFDSMGVKGCVSYGSAVILVKCMGLVEFGGKWWWRGANSCWLRCCRGAS